jgi:hypothetical protein
VGEGGPPFASSPAAGGLSLSSLFGLFVVFVT